MCDIVDAFVKGTRGLLLLLVCIFISKCFWCHNQEMSAVATSCPAAQPQDVASANKTNFLRLDQKWISLIRVHLVAIIFYNALEFEDFIVDPPWIQLSTVISVFAGSIYIREI